MLLGAAYGSVSDIEVMWTLIAAIGLIYSFYNVREALLDRNDLKRRGVANGRRLLAQTNVISETSRFVKQSIFIIIGLLAMFLPEAPDNLDLPWAQAAIGAAIRWGLITASILTTFQSYLGFRARRLLR